MKFNEIYGCLLVSNLSCISEIYDVLSLEKLKWHNAQYVSPFLVWGSPDLNIGTLQAEENPFCRMINSHNSSNNI